MTLVLHRDDPSAAVEAAFTRIWRERMEGLPILHPALQVEAVGLQPWNEHWVGMLVTPWSLSVLLLPLAAQAWVHVDDQQRRFVSFPFGDLAFLGGEEPGLGEYQTCSLFSPMERFASQAEARATAQASLAALLAPPAAERVDPPPPQQPPVPSRRRFLRLGV
jgi:[NiFe] hydrogenase assembly HybE family chaperone